MSSKVKGGKVATVGKKQQENPHRPTPGGKQHLSVVEPKKETVAAFSDEDYSSTSSDSDESMSESGSPQQRTKNRQPRVRGAKRKTVDCATYHRQQAQEEMARATGKVPIEPAKKPAMQPKKEPIVKSDDPKPLVGRLAEAAEDMAPWFKPSEDSALSLDDGLSVEPSASNLDAQPRPRNAIPTFVKGHQLTHATGHEMQREAVDVAGTGVGEGGESAPVEAEKPRRIYEDEEEPNPSSVPEEGKAVSRAEFLAFLDLLGKEDEGRKPPKAPSALAEETGKEEEHGDGESKELRGSPSPVDEAFNWEEETRNELEKRSAAAREEAKKRLETKYTADGKPVARAMEEGPLDPSAALYAYYHTKDHFSQQAEQLAAFQQSVTTFEDVLTSDRLNHKLTSFLELYHKEFLATQPQRAQGEYSHREYSLFSMYSEGIQAYIMQEMQRHIPTFEVEEFVEELFDQEQLRLDLEEEGGVGSETTSYLSLEAWDVLLSILKFENFAAVMDEFIEAYYGVELTKESSPSPTSSASPATPPPSSSPLFEKTQVATTRANAATTSASIVPSPPKAKTPAPKVSSSPASAPSGKISRSFREMKNLPSLRR